MSLDAAAAMGRRAFAWIVRHAEKFVQSHASDGDRAEPLRVKRCAELALVGDTLRESTAEGASLLAMAWEAVGRGEGIARLVAVSPLVAASYLPFRMAGLRSTELERRLMESDWLGGPVSLPPFGRMAVGVTLESIGVAPPWDMARVVGAIPFFDRPTAQTPAIRAAFLAHAVMWRSDMGRNRAGVGVKATALYRQVSPEWQALLVDAGLLDPLAEMAIADVCVGDVPPDATLAALCQAQRDDGAMPGHRIAQGESFDYLYHPTVVAALAGAIHDVRSAALAGQTLHYWTL
jgi:hypothetical protein